MRIVIDGAITAGKVANEHIHKFSREQYEEKVEALENIAKELDFRLSSLEQLRGEICEFWKDEKAIKYTEILNNEITKVKNQQERVARMKNLYQNISTDLTQSEAKVEGLLDAASTALNMLGI